MIRSVRGSAIWDFPPQADHKKSLAPDVGVPEDLAKFYFAQLTSGMVSIGLPDIAGPD